jgi:O-antigen/teichoic acid export membrane protein
VGSSLARSSLINLIGLSTPLVVATLTMPLVLRGIGAERFGLLSLAWAILVYVSFLDFGLTAATTQYVAERLSRGEPDRVPQVIATALTAQCVVALVGALILFTAAPLLASRIFSISDALVDEAAATLRVVAVGIPIMTLSNCWLAVLQGAQQFGLLNAIRIPSSSANYLLPLVGLALGFQLPGIAALVVAGRSATLLILTAVGVCFIHRLGGRARLAPRLLPELLRYGWLTILGAVNLMLGPAERVAIGTLASTAAVSFYAIPFEVITRLTVVPASLGLTLFPAFSALQGEGNTYRLGVLFARSIKFCIVIVGPLTIFPGVYADQLLELWIGGDFAVEGAPVLRIMTVGALASAVSYVPYHLLNGIGRPDVVTKVRLVELPMYLLIMWQLTSAFGAIGAAAAWTARSIVDCLLAVFFAVVIGRLTNAELWRSGAISSLVALLILASVAWMVRWLGTALPMTVHSVVVAAILGGFGWISWRVLLSAIDRAAIVRVLPLRLGSPISSGE